MKIKAQNLITKINATLDFGQLNRTGPKGNNNPLKVKKRMNEN